MYHIGLQVLRAKIRGFQATGETITARISKAEKERKNRLWNEKRRLGVHCRHHLVAYGLLRGIPYARIERCAPNNRPNPQFVLDIMLAHNGWTKERGMVRYDLTSVQRLLEVTSAQQGVSPARVTSAQQARSPVSPSTPASPLPVSVGPTALSTSITSRLLRKLLPSPQTAPKVGA